MIDYIYFKFENTIYKIGGGECLSFKIGKTKRTRLKKLATTPCRDIKKVEIISQDEWDENLEKYGYTI